MDRLSYSSQTAQMIKLVEALEEPENVQKIKVLSITASFEDMKTKHEIFEKLFSEQAGANADLRQLKSASAIRRNLEKTLKVFLNLLSVMKEIQGWEVFYSDINELVKAAKNSTQVKPKDTP